MMITLTLIADDYNIRITGTITNLNTIVIVLSSTITMLYCTILENRKSYGALAETDSNTLLKTSRSRATSAAKSSPILLLLPLSMISVISATICSPRHASSGCVVASVGRDGAGSGPSLRRDDDVDDVAIAQKGNCTTP
jgi:hypothetical protein